MTCNLTVEVYTILVKLGQHYGVLFVTMIVLSVAWFGEIFIVFLDISTIICRDVIFLHMYHLVFTGYVLHEIGVQKKSPFSITTLHLVNFGL
ncbi:unnamed protein product [Trifolium pratense]|uniref:Uncharacterized protein n=1 Tax=Trifolium pratense TaxID=57577 RepID=A0ACB0KIA7_TRIPR|nr:unnamed protein product [Trifolium pratense]